MPDAKSGRVHILRQFAVPVSVAAEDTGNHFLLSLTRRSERCRSGSQISGARLYERHGAKRRCRSVEVGWLFNGLKKRAKILSYVSRQQTINRKYDRIRWQVNQPKLVRTIGCKLVQFQNSGVPPFNNGLPQHPLRDLQKCRSSAP